MSMRQSSLNFKRLVSGRCVESFRALVLRAVCEELNGATSVLMPNGVARDGFSDEQRVVAMSEAN